jgi:hypothetical protein
MIECRLGQIVVADDEKALERLGARALPPKVAYTAAKLLSLVRKELRIYRELHDKLVKEYGVETTPGSYQVPPTRMVEFVTALSEVLETTVSIDWTPLTLDELGADPLRPDDLVALEPFITPAPPPKLATVPA